MLRVVRSRCEAPIYTPRGWREPSGARIYSEGAEGAMRDRSRSPLKRVIKQTQRLGKLPILAMAETTYIHSFFLREMLMQEVPHPLTTGTPAHCIAIATVFTFELSVGSRAVPRRFDKG